MLKKVKITNFKSHEETLLDLSNLTVLCGINGVGKSSIIHALLLLREAHFSNSNFEYLDFTSNPVIIGTAKDALYQYSFVNEIIFEIVTDYQHLIFSFESSDIDLIKTKMSKSKNINHIIEKEDLEKESLFNRNCQFISAARFGPKNLYKKDDVVVEVYNQISVIEGQAEHFVHFLNINKDKDVIESLRHKNSSKLASDLLNQVTAWEREISTGVNIIVKDLGSLGYELKYQFNTESATVGRTDDFKASNVGFGVTYVMPIIIAILSANQGAILFIENPEAHLHPNGQAKIAELICLAAQAGVQIILETHSDHIINGILVQCKKNEDDGVGINKENVSIYHMERDEKTHSTKTTKIKIEEGGRIRYTPKGFFDQFTIDRKFLMGF